MARVQAPPLRSAFAMSWGILHCGSLHLVVAVIAGLLVAVGPLLWNADRMIATLGHEVVLTVHVIGIRDSLLVVLLPEYHPLA